MNARNAAVGLFSLFALAAASQPLLAAPGELDVACVMQMAETADSATTIAELRERCQASEPMVAEESSGDTGATEVEEVKPVEKRLAMDRESAARPFTLMAHKPNYFLLGAWNADGWNPDLFREQFNEPEYENDDIEAQFQISLKVPLAIGLFNDHMDIYGAYTNRSFWQVYNDAWSRPFRETNHEPELWAQFKNDWTIGGITNSVNSVGIVHQSNGRGGVLSRSWNRVYGNFVFQKGRWAFGIKPWVWLKDDREDSDNPDITEYLGHSEMRLAYARHGHVFSMMSRNNLESGFDRGAVELAWSFPVFGYPYLKGYVQYFYGYGESLIDYDQRVNRIGVGISLTDWLD